VLDTVHFRTLKMFFLAALGCMTHDRLSDIGRAWNLEHADCVLSSASDGGLAQWIPEALSTPAAAV